MDTSSGDLTNGGGATSSAQTTTKPLTMFYNGGVAVFHLPQDKAEVVMNMAAGEDGGGGGRHLQPNHGDELLAKLRQGMPAASKISLQRFFQKRKERYASRHLISDPVVVWALIIIGSQWRTNS